MIKFNRICLSNGLRVLVHEDRSTPLVAMNILYDVGSRDEDPDNTGMAHLFEHLMFGGTASIPEFDRHLQIAGGENNAFTNPDITDYYITLPANNIETGFWLESDRMHSIDFSQKNLDIQKNVVIEEFNQRYLNQPYGDAMLLLRPLSYKVHPYRWPTIGMEIDHIRNTPLHKIKEFFYSHYAPDNAILTLTGNITTDYAFRLAEKWFGSIEKRFVTPRNLPAEPLQTEERILTAERDVPASALYKAWHIGPRLNSNFYTLDLITDLLAGGESGRLYTKLVREKKLFTEINAYITSDIDPGLVIFHGKTMKGIDIYKANDEVNNIILTLKEKQVPVPEMEKVKNKYESANIYSNTNILNKALNLAYYELLGNPDMINTEVDLYRNTDKAMVLEAAGKYFTDINCSTLFYKSIRDSSK
ncbi:MAG: insulinase family protein [Bacteroidales bacterium]|jgi:predicted Zn-dependent peptidase|nr:insulinase family protein [Bacteroidales bacterium]